MSARYVLADLWRNPRRSFSTMAGVVLGVGLFCGVLFFVDGLSASMTQRAVEPLPIDMQRIVTERAASSLELSQSVSRSGSLPAGGRATVEVTIANPGELQANEVTVRSLPGPGLEFVAGSAAMDGVPLGVSDDNPFASGSGQTGFNVGTLEAGGGRSFRYVVEALTAVEIGDDVAATSYSSRESVSPIPANQPPAQGLAELTEQIAQVPGVAHASELFIADLGPDTLIAGPMSASGPSKIFGFDTVYASRDPSIEIVAGELNGLGAVVSAETADSLALAIGSALTVALPDGSTLEVPVTGIADLSRSRSLFSSRRGGDLETFVYTRNAVVVSPAMFAEDVFPAYERAIAEGSARLKSPPIREVDISLDRELLDADPATATGETQRIAVDVMAVAEHQDYLLDNISNTLTVAAADAQVAKRLFVFLGLPGGLLAAMLAAYAGNVLAEAQRREQATLRIRGASRRRLLRMLALRTTALAGIGAVIGVAVGYGAASVILGRTSLARASTGSLVSSAILGALAGFIATGFALYLTGRRSIDREINEDRARLTQRAPLWQRARLDLVGLAVIAVGTGLALRAEAFDGAPGSVYFGRSVQLNLALLVLPMAVWLTGSLLGARLIGTALARTRPSSSAAIGRPVTSLYRRSIGRRSWAISNGAIVVSLIVALATSLATFTASYDQAKLDDARYANGADIRITPSPTAIRAYSASDGADFGVDGVGGTTPVIYGLSNVILRSDRTSDPANLAAIDAATYNEVAPVDSPTATALRLVEADPSAILLSGEMAGFLQVEPGDSLNVLLARSTADQTEIQLRIAGLFERLPGFPDGADAVMSIDEHTRHVVAKPPDFFLASTANGGAGGLEQAVAALENGPGAVDELQIDSRLGVLDRDQSSLAALNIVGLVALDSSFALAMATVTMAIFVFGLLLQRRREYIVLRAQGLRSGSVRGLITAEAATVALGGVISGLIVGVAMGYYFVTVLRPLFVLTPAYTVPVEALALPVLLLFGATFVASLLGSRLVNSLQPTELLRDD